MIYKININPEKINGKNIFISGGTGSFGKKMLSTLLTHFQPAKIIIYSRDEYKQSLLKEQYNPTQYKCLRYFLGDVRDYERLSMALKQVDIVFHTSALKRIQECEYNPMEAVKTNIIGTDNIIKASIANRVKYVIGLSTDKACAPVNLYGGTKLVAEKLIINGNLLSGGVTKFAVVRYGNQFNSRGSLVEIFKRLTDQKLPLTVTDPKMTRFTVLLQEAVNFVLMCFDMMSGGEIFIPKLPSYSVEQMVQAFDSGENYKIIGSRAGEKHHELMINADESHEAWEFDDFFIIVPSPDLMTFDFTNYEGLNKRQRAPNTPYSSGDNVIICDQRLRRLIHADIS
jgi:UDP-N-acetylglucosamine 4,6-dehydratase